ncbi:MAG: TIGR03862 family flavoprotein [Proteobacteria bacterium]|nr:TIGR03862 family flavoprotein [Pseudomonadota bacterium]
MSASKQVAVIGAGPAGLMAAEVVSATGVAVTVYERMPSVGRKLLMAGRGGLNLTHSEDYARFVTRYGDANPRLRHALDAFPPSALVAWADGLGQQTFVGSSGRVFPKAMKTSPLLRAWLARLDRQGVKIRTRSEWLGWDGDALRIRCAEGREDRVFADAVVLALGGASWPRLGSNGAWAAVLQSRGVDVAKLQPANCGFTIAWSESFQRFAGNPLKNIALGFEGQTSRGDAVIARYGIEGGAVYALSAQLRDAIAGNGCAVLSIDLRPNLSPAELVRKLSQPQGSQSLTNYLRKAVHLSPPEINLLREVHGASLGRDASALPQQIKSLKLTLTAPQSLDRAISTAGGVSFASLDENLMLKSMPGVFVAGEMLDWEAPTGGYLLQACFATGVAAAKGALNWLGK